MHEIEILYLRHPLHPNISMLQPGPGIDRIVREGDTYVVIGAAGGPLDRRKVEVPLDNVAAVLWKQVDDSPVT